MILNTLRWTVRDLEVMPDDGGWKRHEIIDGELIMTRAPHIQHQGAAMGLGYPFSNLVKTNGPGTCIANLRYCVYPHRCSDSRFGGGAYLAVLESKP
jgi:hypothetical protein